MFLLFLLLGCTPQVKPDPRLAQLETRLAETEARLERTIDLCSMLGTNFNHFKEAFEISVTNQLELRASLGLMLEAYDGEVQRLDNVIGWLRSNRVASATYRPAAAPRRIMGVASSVYERIRSAAEREWPGDYAMQVFEIRRQIEAYQRLNP